MCLRVGAALVCRAVLFLAFGGVFLCLRLFRRAQHLVHLGGSSLPAFALDGGRRRLFCRRRGGTIAASSRCTVTALRKQLQVHRRAALASFLEVHILRVLFGQQVQTVGHKFELVPHEDAVARLHIQHRAFLALIDAARGVFVLRGAVGQRLHQAAHRRTHDVLPRRGISRVALGPHRQRPALRIFYVDNFDHV